MNKSKYPLLALILIIIISSILGIYIVTSPKPVQERPKAEAAGKPILSFDISPSDKEGDIKLIINVDPQGQTFYTCFPKFSFSGDVLSVGDITPPQGDLMAYSEVKDKNIIIDLGRPDPYYYGSGKQKIASIEIKRGKGPITFTWDKTATYVAIVGKHFTYPNELELIDVTFPALTTEPVVTPTVIMTPPSTTITAPQGLVCAPTASGAVCSWTPVPNAVSYKVKIIGESGESNYNVNVSSFTADGAPGKTYTFKVAAVASDGSTSDWSTTQFTVPSQIIAPIVTITPPFVTPTFIGGTVTLNLSLAFHGVLIKPTGSNITMPVKVTLTSLKNTLNNVFTVQKTVTFTATDKVTKDKSKMVVWDGQAVFEIVPEANDYAVLIKGPKHLQKRICVENPTETKPGRYSCSAGEIVLKPNDVKTLDYSTVLQWSGDLPNQDGMIDSYDIAMIRNYIDFKIANSPVALKNADINLDNLVNTMDFSLLIQSLQNRVDEQ